MLFWVLSIAHGDSASAFSRGDPGEIFYNPRAAAGCAEASQFAEWMAADSQHLINSVVACNLLVKREIQNFSRLD